MEQTVYKILTFEEWESFSTKGVFEGSEIDKRDGFIHLSTASQVEGTLNKYFIDQKKIMLVALGKADMGSDLKFEPSRNGENFPHYYDRLKTDFVPRPKSAAKPATALFPPAVGGKAVDVWAHTA